MKRRIPAGAALLALLVPIVPLMGPGVAFAGTPCGNGDVNGSGKIDIADAIYLLAHLYAQGPAPEAIESVPCDSCCPEPPPCDSCCLPCPSSSMPATGQTTCYDTAGNAIDCTSTVFPGQDALYEQGCPMADRFADNGDGTVTDICTGLMWQKESAPGKYTWQQALRYCEGLDLAGRDDWRLPNVNELQSIVDYSRWEPSIDPVFAAEPWGYWSSSTYLPDSRYAWGVGFLIGFVNRDSKSLGYHVRAVRGRP